MFPDIDYDGRARFEHQITIVSEKHCWRTLGGLETDSYSAVLDAVEDGCHLQSATFVLRHPEVMLCDLSNLEHPLSRQSTAQIRRTFHLIDGATSQLTTGPIVRIRGDGLNPEIAVSGLNKQALVEFKRALLRKIVERPSRNAATVEKAVSSRGLEKTALLSQARDEIQSFYNSFCSFYGRFISPSQWSESGALNVRRIYQPHAVWSKLATLADNKLFILSAGLPLGLAYMQQTRDMRAYYTEVHRQNDPSELHRLGEFTGIYPNPQAHPGSWLIIDKAYTGGSIRLAAKRLRRQLGYSTRIKSVALFPKSLEAVAAADYIVYAGRLVEVAKVIGELSPATWHLQLLDAPAL